MSKHTPEAVKAAEKIAICVIEDCYKQTDKKGSIYRLLLDKLADSLNPKVAAIIDQETAAPELLEACKLAEPILDGASATAHESGQTMIPGARPVWEAVKAALAKAEPESGAMTNPKPEEQ